MANGKTKSSAPVWLAALIWAAQIALASGFAYLGYINLTLPIDQLIQNLGWMPPIPPPVVRFVGVLELIGAAGVIFPWLLRITPAMTSVAAIGLLILEFLTIEFHLGQGQWNWLLFDFALLTNALIVAWGRGSHSPVGYVHGL